MPLSAEVLREAANRPYAPPRLLRAADAVLEGKFTWEDVAKGQCDHPFARSLFTPKAERTLWPFLQQVADEPRQQPERHPVRAGGPDEEEEDFSLRTYGEDVSVPPESGGGN
ncbi:hypothetical protein FG385_03040 [Amycolatopsis alkalitolerans]|uniref:Uncharacterized protein n=2 Tax=Amycolatopsis alkalitolerans TaxID=2547244 RepID=A0A5C4M8S4_9PSEU|nr:hypothetical protein FG385_03040 [Amycolatopsis alkalitolerans]